MTVIAWDGRTLAADKMATDGGGIARTVTKIRRGTYREPGWTKDLPVLTAITGSWDVGAELRAWWLEGAVAEAFPKAARDDKATLILITKYRIVTFCSGPIGMEIEAKQCAFGSGRDFAEAAMHLGKSAVEAVEVACHFQTDCGRGIDRLELGS